MNELRNCGVEDILLAVVDAHALPEQPCRLDVAMLLRRAMRAARSAWRIAGGRGRRPASRGDRLLLGTGKALGRRPDGLHLPFMLLGEEDILGGRHPQGCGVPCDGIDEGDGVGAPERIHSPRDVPPAAMAGPDEIAGEAQGRHGDDAVEHGSTQDGLGGEREVSPGERPVVRAVATTVRQARARRGGCTDRR
jgi:hypothetical protein